MTRDDMLNEHINMINILEDINLSKIKSKTQQISSTAASGNILKMNQVFNTLPDVSIESLKTISRKKYPSEYKNSEMMVSKKLKGASRIKDVLTVALTSLMVVKKESKDPEITEKVNNSLEQFNSLLLKIGNAAGAGGLSFVLLAYIIQFFMSTTSFLAPLLAMTGVVFVSVAAFIFLTGMTIAIFIEAKKMRKKVTV